jgi:hypothetical protein
MRPDLRHKAALGELRQGHPVGLDYDHDGRAVITRDEAAADAIAAVYRRFGEFGSARQVLLSPRGWSAAAAAEGLAADHLGAVQLPGHSRLLAESRLCWGGVRAGGDDPVEPVAAGGGSGGEDSRPLANTAAAR